MSNLIYSIFETGGMKRWMCTGSIACQQSQTLNRRAGICGAE